MIAMFLAFLSVPKQLAAVEYVDLIELNNFYDQNGKHVYSQVIFYERTPTTGKFQVRAWCMVDESLLLNRRPIKNEATGIYSVDWFDSDGKVSRKTTSRLYRESWSQIDPEVLNKKHHPAELRIKLAVPVPPQLVSP